MQILRIPIVHMHKEQQKTVIKQHYETGELNSQAFPSDPGFWVLCACVCMCVQESTCVLPDLKSKSTFTLCSESQDNSTSRVIMAKLPLPAGRSTHKNVAFKNLSCFKLNKYTSLKIQIFDFNQLGFLQKMSVYLPQ